MEKLGDAVNRVVNDLRGSAAMPVPAVYRHLSEHDVERMFEKYLGTGNAALAEIAVDCIARAFCAPCPLAVDAMRSVCGMCRNLKMIELYKAVDAATRCNVAFVGVDTDLSGNVFAADVVAACALQWSCSRSMVETLDIFSAFGFDADTACIIYIGQSAHVVRLENLVKKMFEKFDSLTDATYTEWYIVEQCKGGE